MQDVLNTDTLFSDLKEPINKVRKEYKKRKIETNSADFDDLLILCTIVGG